MKVYLMHAAADVELKPALQDAIFAAMMSGNPFDLTRARRKQSQDRSTGASAATPDLGAALAQDLELGTLWNAMADDDEFVYETAKRVLLSSLVDPDAIRYRQAVLTDCLDHRTVVRELYDLSVEALKNESKAGGGLWSQDRPESTLHRSVNILALHVDVLKRLRALADAQAGGFHSTGFTRFFAMLRAELADEYLQTVEQHLRELQFRRGLLESAELGVGDKGRAYVVRRPHEQHWTERLPFRDRTPSHTFTIPPRDEAGFQALADLRARGLNRVADAVAQSADHIRDFFLKLRLELAFYLGCVNLHERLTAKGEPTCFPEPRPMGDLALSATGSYDVCLSLHVADRVVGNDLAADGTSLVLVTGANQGGKSTLLRGLGVAQLMMQAGMFVGAESFRAGVSAGLFTHYKREEDATMAGGKLDEELARMSRIADEITPHSTLLCNESFASTNEREGSEIARQIVRAMVEKQIRVIYVTHMYDLAHGFHEQRSRDTLFLRAERRPDGGRTFKLRAGEPLATSYGADSYRRIFGTGATISAAAAGPAGSR